MRSSAYFQPQWAHKAVHYSEETKHQTTVHGGDNLHQIGPHKVQGRLKEF